jgi:transposase
MLNPNSEIAIPEETRQTAKAAFPKGSLYITLRDELGPIFEDETFADLYPSLGQPAESPARLALVTIMQFLENLTDRQAADAVSILAGKYTTDSRQHCTSDSRQRCTTLRTDANWKSAGLGGNVKEFL